MLMPAWRAFSYMATINGELVLSIRILLPGRESIRGIISWGERGLGWGEEFSCASHVERSRLLSEPEGTDRWFLDEQIRLQRRFG